MTRSKENNDVKFDTKFEVVEAVTEQMTQDKIDLQLTMNNIILDVITKATKIVANERESICREILLEILDEQFKPKPKIMCPECEKEFYSYRGYKMHSFFQIVHKKCPILKF